MAQRPEGEPRAGLADFIKAKYESPEVTIAFEAALERAGLLHQLEEAGIIPLPQNLNPFDPESEEAANEEWASSHPSETAQFIADLEKRDEALRLLYVGSLIVRIMEQD